MAVISKDLGPITAYAAAVNRGYTGTRAEFEELMASYATVAEQAGESAESAEESAASAAQSAASASQSAQNAEGSKYNALLYSNQANGYKNTANTAAQAAKDARDAAQSAQTAAEAAQEGAETAVDGFDSAVTRAISDVNAAGTNQKELAKRQAEKSEAWAVGQISGEDVGVSDPAYHNNAKYYAESAGTSVTTATTKASEAAQSASSAASSAAAAEDAADRAEAAAEQAEGAIEVDDTLSVAGRAADSKAVGDALAEKLDIADLPDTVSNANQLLSEKYVVDTEPYHLRPSGGNGADRALDTIVGGSVVWNQLVQNGNFADGLNAWTPSAVTANVDNNIATINSKTIGGILQDIPIKINHVILANAIVQNVDANTAMLRLNGGIDKLIDTSITGWQTISNVVKYNSIDNSTVYIRIAKENQSIQVKSVNVFDLTQMFGSEIADYIYSLEQATAGVGVAWFRKYFPNDYYDYNPGELMHVSGVSAHKTYDADENVIGNYSLDSSLTLRGIPKLVDGKLSFEGDIYKPDGTVERRYGIVDLGTLSWEQLTTSAIDTGYYFRTSIPGYNAMSRNRICSKYGQSNYSGLSAIVSNYGTSVDDILFNDLSIGSNLLYIIDSSYTDATAFKAAMSGVYLVYELAEPITEEAEPYQSTQILDPYGTEEYVTTSLVPVGHETKYPENLRAKIEGLPWNFANLIAPVEAEFKATRNYTSGSLFIVDNTLYKATANIANGGTITPNTNCINTTLAEIIAAL